MTAELIALLDGQQAGRVLRDKHGKLAFAYHEAWRQAPDAYPISISMPPALSEHPNSKIGTWLLSTAISPWLTL